MCRNAETCSTSPSSWPPNRHGLLQAVCGKSGLAAPAHSQSERELGLTTTGSRCCRFATCFRISGRDLAPRSAGNSLTVAYSSLVAGTTWYRVPMRCGNWAGNLRNESRSGLRSRQPEFSTDQKTATGGRGSDRHRSRRLRPDPPPDGQSRDPCQSRDRNSRRR